MTCHSSFCRAFSLGWGGRSYRYGPSRTLGSRRTVTSGVSTRVAIDRAPRESAASGVIFTGPAFPRAIPVPGLNSSVTASFREERLVRAVVSRPIEQEFVQEPWEHMVRRSLLVLKVGVDQGGCKVRCEALLHSRLWNADQRPYR